MPRVSVTPFSAAHLPGVRALYAQTFGDAALRHFDARFAWSRTQNLAPSETFSWVLEGEGQRIPGAHSAG